MFYFAHKAASKTEYINEEIDIHNQNSRGRVTTDWTWKSEMSRINNTSIDDTNDKSSVLTPLNPTLIETSINRSGNETKSLPMFMLVHLRWVFTIKPCKLVTRTKCHKDIWVMKKKIIQHRYFEDINIEWEVLAT